MKFSELAEYFERLEKTPSRLAMTEILAGLFKAVSSEEIPVVVNLSLGQLRPKFDRLEFNLAERMVLKTIVIVSGESPEKILSMYKSEGDIGEVVFKTKAKQGNSETGNPSTALRASQLTISEVYERLVKIAEDGGQGSQERKVHELAQLLRGLDPLSAKYVARMVVGKLRLGFSDMTILDGLSWMETGGKGKRQALENAYQLAPDVGELAKLVKEVGADKAEDKVEVKLGVPVVPALAQRLKSADEMIEKMGKVGVEPKFDGTRVQIHFRRKGENEASKPQSLKASSGDTLFDVGDGVNQVRVRTFTRNLDETTHMFPEIQRLPEFLADDVDEVILDSEAVGIDPKTGKMMAFQDTIQRKRKHGIEAAAKSIPLTFFVFDVLYLNGRSLVKLPYHERRKILEKIFSRASKPQSFKASKQLIEVPEMVETESVDVLRKKHGEFLEQGLEGALVKKWDGVYEPGRRGWSWVKFKEAEGTAAKLSDTVDAVVMGLYSGRGKRTGFGVGAFLIGIRGDGSKAPSIKHQIPNNNNQNSKSKIQNFVEGSFYTISKVGTGLTDEQWRELKDRSRSLEIEKKPKEYEVDKNLNPDVWLASGLVVEIAADEVTHSPIHTAGLALRFPRLVKFRDDKGPEQVTSIGEITAIKRLGTRDEGLAFS